MDWYSRSNKSASFPQDVPEHKLTTCRKQAVSSQSAELEALEAKLRETEERLKERKSRTSSPAGRNAGVASSPHARRPLGNTFNGQENDRLQQSSGTSSLAAQPPAPGPISASTMAQWRPAPQETSSGAKGNGRDFSAEQLSGQQGGRHLQ